MVRVRKSGSKIPVMVLSASAYALRVDRPMAKITVRCLRIFFNVMYLSGKPGLFTYHMMGVLPCEAR